MAILTLFLGTGIRISELVGIDMDDINFTSNEFSIVRKGGKQDILVFGDEAREALLQYMLERERIQAAPGHEDALFLSLQKTQATFSVRKKIAEKVQAAESIDRLRSWILLSDLDKTEKKRLCETLTEDDPPISE